MSKKVLRTIASLALAAVIVLSGVSAAVPTAYAADAKVSGNIVVMTNMVTNQSKSLSEISQAFAKENPGVKVQYVPGTSEYEVQMRVRMAANDMPDVFATHGWSKVRYGSFLADLSKESWASKVSPAIKPLVTDANGKLYVLPVDIEKCGFVYNGKVLAQYGIMTIPRTVKEFEEACAKILKESNGVVTPIHLGGGDDWMIGQIFDLFGIPASVSPKVNDRAAIASKTYNWKSFEVVPTFVQNWVKKGYFNKDALTAKHTDSIKALAEGKAAFVIHAPFIAIGAKELNPNGIFGIMPVPAINEGDPRTFSGGEHLAVGAWNGSKSLPAAKAWIAYLAKEENVKKFCEASGMPAGIVGVQPDLGNLTKYHERYPGTPTYGYFDRDLPDGIWQAFLKNGADLFGMKITPKQFNDNMAKEYNRLK